MKIIWKKQEIFEQVSEFLDKQKDDENLICIITTKETKEQRTLTQNSMFHWLFGEISKHLWEPLEFVKYYFLAWCFWIEKKKYSKLEIDIPKIASTTLLNKEEAIFFIDVIIKFIDKHKVPCKYSSKEIQSLYDSYIFLDKKSKAL